MKTIKTLLLVGMTPFLLTTLNSCTDYQDEIDALDNRVTKLEELVDKTNTNLASIQSILNALTNGYYITGVTPITGGYTINFGKYDPNTGSIIPTNNISIYDGTPATTKEITVKKVGDDYYWYLGNDPLTDENDNPIRVNAISPKVQIIDGYWHVSTDGGKNYVTTGVKATGDKGEAGITHVRIKNIDFDNLSVTLEVPGQGTVVVPVIQINPIS